MSIRIQLTKFLFLCGVADMLACKIDYYNNELASLCGLRMRSSAVTRDLRTGLNNESKIYYGGDASSGEFPWMVMVQLHVPEGNRLCGGSLISYRWIITTAFCVDGAQSDITNFQSFARYGCIHRSSASCMESQFSSSWIVPTYDPSTFENDIALLRMSTAATASWNVVPICLTTHRIENGKTMITTGWGSVGNSDTFRDGLKKGTLKTVAPENCGTVAQNPHVCTRFADGRICGGDFGGPLIGDKDNDERWVLYGVASFGTRPCNSRIGYDGFVDVSAYVDDIVSQVKANP